MAHSGLGLPAVQGPWMECVGDDFSAGSVQLIKYASRRRDNLIGKIKLVGSKLLGPLSRNRVEGLSEFVRSEIERGGDSRKGRVECTNEIAKVANGRRSNVLWKFGAYLCQNYSSSVCQRRHWIFSRLLHCGVKVQRRKPPFRNYLAMVRVFVSKRQRE